MASKRSVEALQSSLEAIDARIADREQLLRKDRESRRKLLAQIARAQAEELMGIIEERELTFEDAKGILAAAGPSLEDSPDDEDEEVDDDEQAGTG